MMLEQLNKINKTYVLEYTDQLIKGQVTLKQIHNKKHYAKRTRNNVLVLELSLIEELFKGLTNGR